MPHDAAEPHDDPAGRAPGGARPEVQLAARQYGVVTRGQLVACGVSASAISRWVTTGRLVRLHQGVYAFGHAALVPEGRRLAAVFACGPRAWLAETDGGAMHGLCSSRGGRFAVVVPHGRARPGRREGIVVRESCLTADDVTIVRGVPVTSVARTIVDVAARHPDLTGEVIDTAIQRRIYDQAAMDRQLATRRRGVGRVRKALAKRHPEAHRVLSGWERRMLELLDAHALPRPEVNPTLVELGLSPDLLWRAHRVVVEWDSWAHHHTRERFEADRAKTVALQTAGYTVLRFTHRQTRDQPEVVVGAIRAALHRVPPRSR